MEFSEQDFIAHYADTIKLQKKRDLVELELKLPFERALATPYIGSKVSRSLVSGQLFLARFHRLLI